MAKRKRSEPSLKPSSLEAKLVEELRGGSKSARAVTAEEKEQKFCEAIFRGLTKRAAAIRAGYSAKSASQIATELMQRQSVRAKLEAFYRRDEAELLIDRERVRRKWLKMALADPSDAFDDDWQLRPKRQIPPAVRLLICSARVWDSPEQGAGSAGKVINSETLMRGFLKAFPPPPPQAETLEDAVAEVEQEMSALFDRMEEDDEVEDDGDGEDPS